MKKMLITAAVLMATFGAGFVVADQKTETWEIVPANSKNLQRPEIVFAVWKKSADKKEWVADFQDRQEARGFIGGRYK